MSDEEMKLTQDEPEKGAPEWVVTFGDLMSLLLTFFVLLLSFSQMDVAKFKELAGSLEQAFGVQRRVPVYQPPKGMKIVARDFDQAFVEQAKIADGEIESVRPDDLSRELQQLLATLEAQGMVEFESREKTLILRLLGHATLDSGQADLKSQMIPTLRAIGKLVGKSSGDILVAGHTDNVPIRGGKFRSNLELSVARAASVVDFFLTEKLVKPDKIAAMGYGEYRPVVPNDSQNNRQKNRRVEIILVSTPSAASSENTSSFSTKFLLSPGP